MKLQNFFFRFQYLLPAANAEESHCAVKTVQEMMA